MAGQQDERLSSTAREATETTSLLDEDRPSAAQPAHQYWRRVVFVNIAMLFFLELGGSLLVPGLTVALEEKICYGGDIGLEAFSRDCKAPDVQGKLAALRGWQATAECIPGLLVTVPFGILSDSWGRHRVTILALIGTLLSCAFVILVLYFPKIPVEMVLASPVFMFMGGGPIVIVAMVFTSIADVTPASARGPIFLQFSALAIIADLASGPLAGLVLLKSVWGLLFLAFGFLVLANGTSLFLPDTLSLAKTEMSQPDTGYSAETDATRNHSLSSLQESIRRALKVIKDLQSFFGGHWHVIILMICFVFLVLSRLVQEMLLQYVTKRFDWAWSRASFLLTIRSAVSLANLLVILPGLSQFLITRYKVSVTQKDVWIARLTGIAGVFGALLIAFSSSLSLLIPGLIIFAINGGMVPVVRSLLSSMVESRHTGTLNSLIGVLEMVGLMVAAPALFGSLRVGFEWGGNWIGLPFLCAAAMIAISTAIVCFLPIREKKRPVSSIHFDESC